MKIAADEMRGVGRVPPKEFAGPEDKVYSL